VNTRSGAPCVYIVILFAFISELLYLFKVQREVSSEFAQGTHFAFIREVLCSNFDRNIDCPDRFLIVFLRSSRQVLGYYLELGYDCFLPCPLL
jgi:hypothetical protein